MGITDETVGLPTHLGGGAGASASLRARSEAAAGILPRSRLASAPAALAVICSLSHRLISKCRNLPRAFDNPLVDGL